ncbi:MAG: phenylalanine--tRNA ligase subunit alpha [Candidatus Dadabacteria bacterium]|nr:MAG: phenylalanine--tRNA ligase subunit alpha [Candidatus Dadabacteria bacterium]
MSQDFQEIEKEAREAIAACSDTNKLQQIETAYLGRKGSVTALLKEIRNIEPEKRKEYGQAVNRLKETVSNLIETRREELLAASGEKPLDFDPTLPGTAPRAGTLHPITQLMYELNNAFLSLGFEVYEGPEISSEAYAFDSLNFPADHPARDSMDTYWLEGAQDKRGAERLCLRPHLTGASVRYMQEHKPPFRFVYPGRVYRSESTDASHERAFFQYEALIVDQAVPFSSGRVLIDAILERTFGRKVKTRMRAGFFPFVEPGFEIDMQCLVCEGKGCSICKQVGWLEMMPGGPPHPNVFRAGGIDPEKWQGFYINIGLDRIVMMRHAIDDIRLFHSCDLRFLKQFPGVV